MRLYDDIHNNLDEFLSICETHNVDSLFAFGSSITADFDEETSDVDLLITIGDEDPIERGEKLLSFWEHAEAFFNRKVDLVTEKSIKNPILKKSIDATKVLIYDGRGQKVLV